MFYFLFVVTLNLYSQIRFPLSFSLLFEIYKKILVWFELLQAVLTKAPTNHKLWLSTALGILRRVNGFFINFVLSWTNFCAPRIYHTRIWNSAKLLTNVSPNFLWILFTLTGEPAQNTKYSITIMFEYDTEYKGLVHPGIVALINSLWESSNYVFIQFGWCRAIAMMMMMMI